MAKTQTAATTHVVVKFFERFRKKFPRKIELQKTGVIPKIILCFLVGAKFINVFYVSFLPL